MTERVAERPNFSLGRVMRVKPRHLPARFVSGAFTSIVAGAISLAFGARVGGILLAFPAILAASLTLIERQEDSAAAREDARGAVLGGCGLIAFALVAALAFGHIPGGLALFAAGGAWAAVVFVGYLVLWWR